MISRIEALNFKCLRYISLELEPFHILVGPNASGKSTFLDVISFLQDTVNDGPEQAVLKRAQFFQELVWKRKTNTFELVVELRVPQAIQSSVFQNGKKYNHCRYEIKVGVDAAQGGIRLLAENFFLISKSENIQQQSDGKDTQLYMFPRDLEPPDTIIHARKKISQTGWRKVLSITEEGRAYIHSETTDWNFPLRPGINKAALTMVPEEERFPISTWAKAILSEGVQVLALNSRAMREPCRPDAPLRFRSDGSNLPMVVRNLYQIDLKRFHRWLDHVKTVLPYVQNIEVLEREIDKSPYLVVKYTNGISVPSWLLSDGTLRLLALTFLAYIPTQSQIFLIEEPENGIHPKALEAVYQSLSSVYDSQILCATHSPLFLGLSNLSHLLCFALNENGTTDTVHGQDHPALKAWKGQIALDTLYAAGVLG